MRSDLRRPLGAAVLTAVWVLARRRWSLRVANVAVAPLALNPFVVFNDASYYSHTSCLLFLVLATHFLLEATEDPRRKSAFALAGLAAGIAMTIRQYTTVAVLGLAALYLLARLLRSRDGRAAVIRMGVAALPFAACVGLLLAYNH